MSEVTKEAVKETETEAKTYSEEQFKGLLADKQTEVKKRQSLEAEIAEFKAKQAKAPTAGDTAGDNEDAPLTKAEFKRLLAEEKKADADKAFNALEAETAVEAKQKFTADSAGEGLDYDSVISAGQANLTEGDKLAIRQSKNPAAEKYRRCIFNTPELSQKAEEVRTAKLLENVKLKGRVPGSGATAETANLKDVSKMSAEELDKLAEELE